MKPYVTTTLAYLGFGIAWILLSDRAVEAMVHDPAAIARVQSMKGLLFVALSALLILHVSRQLHLREQQREAEKTLLFQRTMQAVQHVLLNFLNQIQIVTLEAEETPDFDVEALEIAQRTILETEASIVELSSLQDLSEHALQDFVTTNLGNRRSLAGDAEPLHPLEASRSTAVE